jgi:hypothetical protein
LLAKRRNNKIPRHPKRKLINMSLFENLDENGYMVRLFKPTRRQSVNNRYGRSHR